MRIRSAALAGLALAATTASTAQAAPELSTSDRLDDRRYVAIGPRAYDVGTEAGRYPAMGFHTRGEMGGIWSPPIKLLDGLWFGIDNEWIGPATRFTSGYGHVRMRLPGSGGLRSSARTSSRRGARRARRPAPACERPPHGQPAHADPLGADVDLPVGRDQALRPADVQPRRPGGFAGGALVFTEQGSPAPETRAARLGGGRRRPPRRARARTGAGFRGPQEPPSSAPPRARARRSAARAATTPPTAGHGRRAELRDQGAGAGAHARSGSASPARRRAPRGARAELARLLDAPARGAAREDRASASALARRTRLVAARATRCSSRASTGASRTSPTPCRRPRPRAARGQRRQALPAADGKAATRALPRRRLAGLPVAVRHRRRVHRLRQRRPRPVRADRRAPARAARRRRRSINGDSGKVVHEVITDGSVYFGAEPTRATPTRRRSSRAPSR